MSCSVESDLSITGGVADHRLRLSSSNIEAFSALFLSKLLELSGSNETKLLNHLASLSKGMKQHDQWATECAKDLYNQAKSSLVVAGSHLPDSVHLLTYKINKVLGNQTTCLTCLDENSFDDLASMCDALSKDDIDTVVFLSGNQFMSRQLIGAIYLRY